MLIIPSQFQSHYPKLLMLSIRSEKWPKESLSAVLGGAYRDYAYNYS